MTSYFASASEWLGKVAAEFLEDKQRLGSMDFNFRMIDYSKGYGTKKCLCKPQLFSYFRQLLAPQRFWIIDPDPTEWSVRTAGGDGGQDGPSTWRPEHPSGRLVSPSGDQWQVPSPLRQVTDPEARRLSCVTFMAPPKVSICLVI